MSRIETSTACTVPNFYAKFITGFLYRVETQVKGNKNSEKATLLLIIIVLGKQLLLCKLGKG